MAHCYINPADEFRSDGVTGFLCSICSATGISGCSVMMCGCSVQSHKAELWVHVCCHLLAHAQIRPVFSSSWFAGYPSCTANRLKGAGGKRMRWGVGSLLKAVSAHSSTLEGIPWFMLANCLVLGCRNIFPGSSFSLSVSCYSFACCSAYKVSCYNHPIQQPAIPAHCIWTSFFPLHQPC